MPDGSSNLTASSGFPPFLNDSTKTPSFYDTEEDSDLHLEVSRILQEQRFRKVKASYYSSRFSHETEIPPYGFTSDAEVNLSGNPASPSSVARRRTHIRPEDHKRLSVKRAIRELLQIAGEDNWDNDGALAIVPQTVAIAEALAGLFPEFVFTAPPDVSPTPHGEVDFDWVISRNIMLTVSVCPSEKIAVAGIFKDSDYHAVSSMKCNLGSMPKNN